ncbi:MAG: AraC family transcriptional regulator [Xanthomonadales bacterium]|jgi:AraC-like DNA-binding protein|nr:AraC family transcriptional regulator [Xanthomonadales bacterium]
MSVYAPAADYLWELVRSFGQDPKPVFEAAGVDPEIRFDGNARLSRPQMNALHLAAYQATGDVALGLRVVTAYHPSHMGALGYAFLASRTPRDAWNKMHRYSRIESDTFQLTLRERDPEFHVTYFWEGDWSPIDSQIYMVMALLVHLHRRVAGPEANPLRVEFSTPAPAELSAFEDHFQCELRFDQPRELLVLPTDVLDRPSPRAHPELELATEEMVARYLAMRDKADILSQVRAALFECLPEGDVSAQRIAEQLHMTDRTLRRRLDDQGVSFRRLLSDVRRDLALRYLADENLSLTEISYLLGFSEPSSFTRAFRGWTGQSPSAARKEAS